MHVESFNSISNMIECNFVLETQNFDGLISKCFVLDKIKGEYLNKILDLWTDRKLVLLCDFVCYIYKLALFNCILVGMNNDIFKFHSRQCCFHMLEETMKNDI